MEILKHIYIKKFYSAVKFSEGVQNMSRDMSSYSNPVLYHCNACGTDFMVEHKPRPDYFGLNEWGDAVVTCPACRAMHNNFRRKQEIGDLLPAPTSMRLTVTELKDAVLLSVKADTLTMTKERTLKQTAYEEFRFNVKTRVATWTRKDAERKVAERMEFGNPFDFTLYEHSLLRHLRSDNFSRDSRTEIISVLKLLRDTLRRKWKEARHYDLGALYVSCGQTHGRALFQLMNLAFRMTFPDVKNLPPWLNQMETGVRSAKYRHGLHRDELWNDLAAIRKEESGVQGLINALGRPIDLDTPLVRKLLREDIFQIDVILDLLMLTGNLDRMHEALGLVRQVAARTAYKWSSACVGLRDVLKHLATICERRDGAEVVAYLRRLASAKNYDAYYALSDTARLMEAVPEGIRAGARKVKLKRLHDWLCQEYEKYKERDYDLEVPDAVVRRLAMQMDQVKFFLPTRNAQLQAGSKAFHNCVRTYAERVHQGVCQIVYMTDDRGKLTACLEVRDDRLVQAKLKFNKPVYEDSAVNGAVVDWCNKVGLQISTYDVRKMRYPAVLEAVTA